MFTSAPACKSSLGKKGWEIFREKCQKQVANAIFNIVDDEELIARGSSAKNK
jgi:hypothetical protein